MHEVISSSLTVPTKNKSTAYAVLLFLVGNAKEASRRGRQPSAVRVRSAAENFAAHAASPYRPYTYIYSDTLKPPKMGAFCHGGKCERIEQVRRKPQLFVFERSGELCRACGKPLPSPAPHYFRYIKATQNGRSFAWTFFRLCGRFSYKTPAEVKTRANTTRKRRSPYPSACVRSCSERNTCA